MKKFMSLLLSVMFVGTFLAVMGCAPKQEATQAAPTMEQTVPVAGANTEAATAAPTEAAPAE